MGQPVVVARLIPMFSLKADFLFDQTIQLMKIIHDVTGIVYLVMCGNLKYNQSIFTMFHKNRDSAIIYSVQYPIANEEYNKLFLLYETIHLLKNIRNNWCTENAQRLRYVDRDAGNTAIAAWKDLDQSIRKNHNG